MKNIILIIFLTSILITSCNKENETEPLFLEQIFQIDEIFQSENDQLKFTITEINDSRCPSDVVCVWEGEAVVTVRLEEPQQGVIELSTYDNQLDTIGSFSFELVDVSPYPVSTETIELEDYDITLRINELNN